MAKRSKPKPRPRVRRSPYERSLDYATKRFARAIAERETYAMRLADLDKEIPYLQTVIRALTPTDDPLPRQFTHNNLVAASGQVDSATVDQAEFLTRFVKPIPAMRGVSPDTIIVDDVDDPFLPAAVSGEELLP